MKHYHTYNYTISEHINPETSWNLYQKHQDWKLVAQHLNLPNISPIKTKKYNNDITNILPILIAHVTHLKLKKLLGKNFHVNDLGIHHQYAYGQTKSTADLETAKKWSQQNQ